MSVCLCSFRALSRSRTSSPKTLAPFLYQTATIQQHNPVARRNASDSSRPTRPEHHVPFEGEELPPALDDAKVNRRTTITGSERAAFEKLYKKYNKAEDKAFNEHELDQIADEYYEDDDDNSKDKSPESLDAIFDAVLSGNQSKPTFTHPVRARSKPQANNLGALAERILAPEADRERRKKKEEAAKKQARIKELRSSEKERIKALIEAAPTDQALWAVLEKEVFSVIRAMDLEGNTSVVKQKSKKSKSSPKSSSRTKSSELSPTDATIVHPNYGAHLISAAQTLRKNFPASPLMFNILPTIKSLGRSSYALGANTALYKILIHTAFRQNHSYIQICSLLRDMDNGGIEYDPDVMWLVDEILQTHWAADKGHYGRSMQAVERLQLYQDGAEKLRTWREAIAKRLGHVADKKPERGPTMWKPGQLPSANRFSSADALASDAAGRPGQGQMKVGRRRGPEARRDVSAAGEEDVPFVEDEPLRGSAAEEDMDANVEGYMRDPDEGADESARLARGSSDRGAGA